MMQLFHRRSAGFTLVEILVVLAILGLLSAILFPVFARVREEGRRTTCENNLHQIGLALQQYTSDNNGIYPALTGVDHFTPQGDGVELKWSDMIQLYLKSTSVFDCATHTERYPAGCEPPYAGPMFEEITGDYLYDWYRIPNAQGKTSDEIKREMLVQLPAQTALVHDAGWIGEEKSLHYLQATEKEDALGGHICYHSAHNGGANFLFADGHVQWLSVAQQANHSPFPLAPWSDWSPSD